MQEPDRTDNQGTEYAAAPDGRRCEGFGPRTGSCTEPAEAGWTGRYCQDCDNARRAANMRALTCPEDMAPKAKQPSERKAQSTRPRKGNDQGKHGTLPAIPPVPASVAGKQKLPFSDSGRGRNRNRSRNRKTPVAA